MIGIRAGIRCGIHAGIAAGVSADPIGTTLGGVTRDALSGVYCPANAAEWAIVMAAAGITSGGPSLLWLCQDPSGSLADAIGTFAGTVSGTPVTYRAAVTGWARLGITGADGGTGLVVNNDAGLPDKATTSMLSLGYHIVPSVPVNRTTISFGGGTTLQVLSSGPLLQAVTGSNNANGSANPTGAVRPFGLLYDVTNNRVTGWSNQEILAPTRVAITGKAYNEWLNSNLVMVYQVGFFGVAAELTNTQIKTLLQVLGWQIPWTPPTTTTLTVALTDSTDPVISTVNFTYAAVVTNSGFLPAASVSAVIALDASLTFVSAVGTGWTCTAVGQNVTCTRSTLVPGAAPTITITVTTANAASTASTTLNASAANAAAATQATQTTVVKLVARDATSLIRCPASATQWADFTAYHVAIGTANFPNVAPSLLWLLQEASGNAADSIGTFTGTASGAPLTYQQPVTGWARLGVSGSDGGGGYIQNAAAGLPDPATTSCLSLGYLITSSVAANRLITLLGGSSQSFCQLLSSGGKLDVVSAVDVFGTANHTGAVRPFGILYDVTNNRVAGWSNLEITTVTRRAATGKAYVAYLDFPGSRLYEVAFFGAAAELTNAQIKALLVALNWAIAW